MPINVECGERGEPKSLLEGRKYPQSGRVPRGKIPENDLIKKRLI
jgi:hypothetical protein